MSTRTRPYIPTGFILVLAGALTAPGAGAAQQAGNPHGVLPEGLDCVACHTREAWKPLRQELNFDHDRATAFDLVGEHASLACQSCHTELKFDRPNVAQDDCESCHADVHAGTMTLDCASCHDPRSFQVVDGEMIHVRTSFPLTGAHLLVSCESCHLDDQGGTFTAVDAECIACHSADYEEEHSSGVLPTTCRDCHTTESWEDATIDHAVTGFELLGAHGPLDCTECHTGDGGLLFPAPTGQDDCFACHQPDYQDEHPSGVLPTTCLDCHTVNTWEGATLEDHAITGFDLLGAHEPLPCADCHTEHGGLLFPEPAGQNDCMACHQSDYQDEHPSGVLPTTCLDCHTLDTWADAILEDHAVTGFELLGAHGPLECTGCHSEHGELLFPSPTAQDDCMACHAADFEVEHPGGILPTTCLDCHTQDTWEDAILEDHAITGFELLGAHGPLECTECHTEEGGLLFPSPTAQDDCISCHLADFEVEHPGGTLPTTCLDCHTQDTWEDAILEDHAITGFELLGAHGPLDCGTCHTEEGGLLFPSPTGQDDCMACHQADYQARHPSGVLPTICLDCHTVDTWEGATLDHALTGFELLGAHGPLDCAACHTADGGLLFPSPAGQDDCFACHQPDYQAQHPSGVLPTTCLDCHTVDTWEGATLDHALTGFELLGAHMPLECADCHAPDGPLLFPIPTGQDDCFACHQPDYQAQHPSGVLPTTCLHCHTVDTWEGATLDHALTGFELLGAHMPLECADCHAPDGPLLFPIPTGQDDCFACHQPDYQAQHPSGVLPTTCLDCHTVDTWEGATLDHALTGFELLGAHMPLECADCHAPDGPLLFPIPTGQDDCFACHESDYQDEHGGTNLPTTCRDCHSLDTWEGATFDHDLADFQLRGAHVSLDCSECHTDNGGLLFPTPSGQNHCMACHESDYQDEHGGSGFPTTCRDCHSLDTWEGATFDHAITGFELLGAHGPLDCSRCHASNGALLFPEPSDQNDCMACHESDYQDEHGGSGFPTTCLDCHSANSWDADFDHDGRWFPIYSGEHRDEWSECVDCHTVPGNLASFSCVDCHEHRQSEVDDEHDEVPDYVYESNACLACHPRGESDD